MKTVIFLLISVTCFAQIKIDNTIRLKAGGEITSLQYTPVVTQEETCIAIWINPTVKTTIDTIAMVKALLSRRDFERAAKHGSYKCKKSVDVRLFNKDYTFEQFRKLIYEK
jgi:hypothetical protein